MRAVHRMRAGAEPCPGSRLCEHAALIGAATGSVTARIARATPAAPGGEARWRGSRSNALTIDGGKGGMRAPGGGWMQQAHDLPRGRRDAVRRAGVRRCGFPYSSAPMLLVVAATEAELCWPRRARVRCRARRGGACRGGGPGADAARRGSPRRRGRCAPGSGIDILDVVVGSEAVYEDLATAQTLAPSSDLGRTGARRSGVRAALPSARVMPIGTTGRVGGSSGCQVEAMEGSRSCAASSSPACPRSRCA